MAETKNLPVEQQAGEYLQKVKNSLVNYAARDYNIDTFLKSAMLSIVESDSLKQAITSDQGKASIFNALRFAASTGLSLNPQEGKAALVAYKNKDGKHIVNYQIMKNGMVDLALASGKVEFLSADYVRENDEFKLKKSVSGDDYDFQPALKDRGEVIGFYAALKLKSGGTHVKWMTVQEIEEHRDKYSSMFKARPDASPWKNSFNSMGTKTVMKALLRSVSISADLDAAIQTDDFIEADFTVHGVSADDAAEKIKSEPEKPEADKKGGDLL